MSKCVFKAYSVLLMVANDENDSLDSEELQSQLDMCDGFLTESEITLLSENSVRGKKIEVESLFERLNERFTNQFLTNSVS